MNLKTGARNLSNTDASVPDNWGARFSSLWRKICAFYA
jgi:hypothetical protein